MIVRRYGADTFGEYAIMIALLQVAEGVADFGTTEVFVRDVSRDPGKATWYLRVLTAAKALQVPAAFAVLVAAVHLIGILPIRRGHPARRHESRSSPG